ncbi:hypothetical protein SOVF_132540 [Spinacia oleracea]|uniref:F-box/FBD/LRR-repeat protein At5g22660-like n=1 Tax=Spinacia oleracea TaxID=3562 RepID=A0ABM3RPG6_SPIOL|nr:F-box/FBD/LRR-repeat protein At5g22660-like [Spinacia oleracea]KNA11711.1 hypothetical protein SOVF_132540 [Spinacia oleracea]
MGDFKILKYYVRQRRWRLSEGDGEDRLSSLPDVILTDILSRLSIHSAAATSVLSHRWRRLWTGVFRLNLCFQKSSEFTKIIDHILQQVTSRKLRDFNLDLSNVYVTPKSSAIESWFRDLCSRNVETIIFNAVYKHEDTLSFRFPACLVNSQSLVILRLCSSLLELKLPENGNLSFQLPNLKEIRLYFLVNFPLWLGILISSCPLLEDLYLLFNLLYLPEPDTVVRIIAPNLKSFSICMSYLTEQVERYRVVIDAPKLENLDVEDWTSIYCFLQNPTKLVKAYIRLESEFISFGEEEGGNEETNYVKEMSKFIGGSCNVNNLVLMLKSSTNTLTYLNSFDLPVFSNLTYLETNFLKVLLVSLHCFPNLEHLKVRLYSGDCPIEQRNWCAPDSIPDCLVSKLKTIQISGLQGVGDELILLAYILCNAVVLKSLIVNVYMKDAVYTRDERGKAYAVWKECQFCRSIFEFPRSSSACEVVVSCRYVTASGNALQNGRLTCEMYVGQGFL